MSKEVRISNREYPTKEIDPDFKDKGNVQEKSIEVFKLLKEKTVGFVPRLDYVNYDSVVIVLRAGRIRVTFDFEVNDRFLASKKSWTDYRRCGVTWAASRFEKHTKNSDNNLDSEPESEANIARYLEISTIELQLGAAVAKEAFLAQFARK